jgi:hypothetical protein
MNSKKRSDNKSGFRGVYWNKRGRNWIARTSRRIDGRQVQIHIGTFDTPEKAALAYNAEAQRLYHDFVKLNHV